MIETPSSERRVDNVMLVMLVMLVTASSSPSTSVIESFARWRFVANQRTAAMSMSARLDRGGEPTAALGDGPAAGLWPGTTTDIHT